MTTVITLTTSHGDLEHGGSMTTTAYRTWLDAYTALRENFDDSGEYDYVPDDQLQRELLEKQGVFSDITEHEL